MTQYTVDSGHAGSRIRCSGGDHQSQDPAVPHTNSKPRAGSWGRGRRCDLSPFWNHILPSRDAHSRAVGLGVLILKFPSPGLLCLAFYIHLRACYLLYCCALLLLGWLEAILFPSCSLRRHRYSYPILRRVADARGCVLPSDPSWWIEPSSYSQPKGSGKVPDSLEYGNSSSANDDRTVSDILYSPESPPTKFASATRSRICKIRIAIKLSQGFDPRRASFPDDPFSAESITPLPCFPRMLPVDRDLL
ncbi:hypothetical protein K402DRAFT_89644 [Aulographum hederae CBS 113979]|uniref:Uncharacterized protein n=1 Tax=Aulographum hederae CBS 113979 TaxID=1176131 RepID=A0A6G1H0B2_9PEZI|nr:hypothetical protein K402DRAFT_89644 [Aulographum hederae CBS 113979]